jgi:hypothetical protein
MTAVARLIELLGEPGHVDSVHWSADDNVA